jgi:hypothetical protein
MALARARVAESSVHFGIAVMGVLRHTYDVLMREIEQTAEPGRAPRWGS